MAFWRSQGVNVFPQTEKPELLAPAGDLEKLHFALAYGADAVYAGGPAWGLRAQAGNFTYDDLRAGTEAVHRQGKKIYITVNVIAQEQDFQGLDHYLQFLAELGVDGLIVSDPGILQLARTLAPRIPLHLSTQASCTNSASADFWFAQGVSRIILARELDRDALKEIRRKVSGELEVFVHGAMCMSYSGRCLLSTYMTGRDANRGACTQPCRWSYALMEEKRPGQFYPLEEDHAGSYIFNSRDLCLLPYVPELAALGLTGWKIEGRMKSAHYVASTVKVYRQAIDTYWGQGEEAFRDRLTQWQDEMDKVSHRPYGSGFFLGRPVEDGQSVGSSDYIREYTFVGRSLTQEERQKLAEEAAAGEDAVWIEQRNFFARGDTLEILSPQRQPQQLTVDKMWNEAGEMVDAARHPQMKVRLDWPHPLDAYSILRRPVSRV